jgi:hypothetical protein
MPGGYVVRDAEIANTAAPTISKMSAQSTLGFHIKKNSSPRSEAGGIEARRGYAAVQGTRALT